MSDQKDTEIILGTGKLLAIFFALVIMCGTFFGLGYALGHSSTPMALQNGQPATLASSSGTKPEAGVTVTAAPASATEAPQTTSVDPNTAANSQVDQVPPANETGSADDGGSAAGPTPNVRPPATAQTPRSSVPPELAGGPTNITVQVAAVTKEEDAQALVAALRRKNYPVFVSPNPSADSLYHVQVGPFAELKDAEAMKSKLSGDGYNAIVKK